MAIRWQCVCVDSTDPARIAPFWEQVLGWRRTYDSPEEIVLEPPAGSAEDGVSPDLLFLRVPEAKSVKNRLHIDLRPDDQAAEGNEFCVLRALTPEELSGDDAS